MQCTPAASIQTSLNILKLQPRIEAAKRFQSVIERMEKHPEICMLKSWKLFGKDLSCSIIQSLPNGCKFETIWSRAMNEGKADFAPYAAKAKEAGFDLDRAYAAFTNNPAFKPSENKSDKKQKSFLDTFAKRMNRYENKHKEEEVTNKKSARDWGSKYESYAAQLEKLEAWHKNANPKDQTEQMLIWVLYVVAFQEIDSLAKSCDTTYKEFRDLKKPVFLKPLIANWRDLYTNPDEVKALFKKDKKEGLAKADVTKEAKELFGSYGVTNSHVLKKLLAATVKGIKSEDKPKKAAFKP